MTSIPACPTFSDRDAALREQMAGRRMAEPQDECAFWQEQRERKRLPIVDPSIKQRTWHIFAFGFADWLGKGLGLLTLATVVYGLISIARGVM